MRRIKRHRSPRGAEASRRALGKHLGRMDVIAKQRRWRSLQESRIIRSLTWAWFQSDSGERCPLRAMARKLGCDPKWIRLLKREFSTPLGAERQLKSDQTWGVGTWTQLRVERDKRKDDHGARYRVPRLKRQPQPTLSKRDRELKRGVERQLAAFLKQHPELIQLSPKRSRERY